MLKSEKIRKWFGITLVLSIILLIGVMYLTEQPFDIIYGVTCIIVLFESIVFLVSFGLTRLIEKLTGQKPVQKPPVKSKENPRSGNVMSNDQGSKKCSKCGNEIENGMIFCDKCGTRI